MNICVIGTGAVGGMLAARLVEAGETVSVVDRGEHLAAIQRDGLTLLGTAAPLTVRPAAATHETATLGPQELVILAVKAGQLAAAAELAAPLVSTSTTVLTVQNGIPWWYFYRHGGPLEGRRLQSLDPEGVIARLIPAERILGGIVYPASTVDRPGVIRIIEGDRLAVGELDGRLSPRLERVTDALKRAGFRARAIQDVRPEIWLKAWGTLSFNPISALTGGTLRDICRFPSTRALVVTMMREAQAIAERLGITFRHTIEQRIQGTENVGAHRTSMLQDLESARPLELDALVGSIIELGEITGVPTPAITAVHACARLLDTINLGAQGVPAAAAAAPA